MYVRDGIVTNIRSSSRAGSAEFLLLDSVFPTRKGLLAGVYKAPSVNGIQDFQNILGEYSHRCEDVIVIGDFNEDRLKLNTDICCAT